MTGRKDHWQAPASSWCSLADRDAVYATRVGPEDSGLPASHPDICTAWCTIPLRLTNLPRAAKFWLVGRVWVRFNGCRCHVGKTQSARICVRGRSSAHKDQMGVILVVNDRATYLIVIDKSKNAAPRPSCVVGCADIIKSGGAC